jgi:hypothetical protein
MISFREWKKRQDETFRVSPSIVDDEGDGIDVLAPKLINRAHPGAMPVYSRDELPPTKNNGGKKSLDKIVTRMSKKK